MKKIAKLLAAMIVWLCGMSAAAAQSTEAEFSGENFSLEGALNLFSESESPEQFERKLNSEDARVNNLDLNGDGEIDYLRVVDHHDDGVHALVIQAAFSKSDIQDVAIIELEKTGSKEAIVQIVGAEELYGEQHIVEPYSEEMRGGRGGPMAAEATFRIVVNVWAWPAVRYVYRPSYRVWVSPWHLGYTPRWWRPWRPTPLRVYVGWHRPLQRRFHVVRTHRVVRAHRVYAPHRRTSSVVHRRVAVKSGAGSASRGVAVQKTTHVRKGQRGAAVVQKKQTKKGVVKKNGKVRGAKVSKKSTTVKARKKRR